jgi:hypothetical protein
MKNAPCMNLITKKLFIPELQPDAFKEKPEAGFEGCFWCSCTATEVGPDDRQVNLRGCSDAGRGCYKSLE